MKRTKNPRSSFLDVRFALAAGLLLAAVGLASGQKPESSDESGASQSVLTQSDVSSRPAPREATTGVPPIRDGFSTSPAEEYYVDEPGGLIVDGYPRRRSLLGCRHPEWFQYKPYLWYGQFDFKLWWMDGVAVPALVTTSPVGTDRALAGVLGEPTTATLYGGGQMFKEVQPGGELRFGRRIAIAPANSIEFAYLSLGSKAYTFGAATADIPILARPFSNVEPGMEGEDAWLISFPSSLEGSVDILSQTEFEAAEMLYRRRTRLGGPVRVDLITGWRSAYLSDDLTIQDSRTALSTDGGLVVGAMVDQYDRFASTNRFNGWTIGLDTIMRRERWSLQVLSKIGLGNTRSKVTIDGLTTSTTPIAGGAPVATTTSGGLLAQPTNIGVFQKDTFSAMPELTLALGYQLTPRWRAHMGYSIIYWTNVARAAEQIDMSVNPSQFNGGALVGPARPEFVWRTDNFWTQGLNFGLDYRY